MTRITTRYTVLKGMTGVEAIVPNEVLVGSVVQNESFSDTRGAPGLAGAGGLRQRPRAAMAIMVEAATAQPRVLADPPAKAFVMAFADSGINLELGFWVGDPEEGVQQLRSDINLSIWRGFQVGRHPDSLPAARSPGHRRQLTGNKKPAAAGSLLERSRTASPITSA